VDLKHEENVGYYVTMDWTCSLDGRSKKYKGLGKRNRKQDGERPRGGWEKY
jgi:hypothetical protein